MRDLANWLFDFRARVLAGDEDGSMDEAIHLIQNLNFIIKSKDQTQQKIVSLETSLEAEEEIQWQKWFGAIVVRP